MKTSSLFARLIAVAALSLLSTNARGNPTTLAVVADAHIDGTNQTANFGTAEVCVISQDDAGGHKAYLRFDASAWGTTNIERLGELHITSASELTRTYSAYLITGDNANDWTETGITWENAPANNVPGAERDFVAYPGQAVTLLGSISGGGDGTKLTIPITPGSVGEAALLEALNTGNRQATIGIRYNSSQTDTVGFYSREHGDGSQAASLTIFPVDRVLPVSMDAHINWIFGGLNLGTADVLALSQHSLGGQKAYLKFDASGLGETPVRRVEKLRVYWSASVNITRTLQYHVITGTNTDTSVGVNDWTETEITWENAPANNTDTNRSFFAFPGETVTLIGWRQYTNGTPREMDIPIAQGSAAETALLTALNSGDRKVTVGVAYNSSQASTVGIFSREREQGIYTPTLWLNPPAAAPTLRWVKFEAGQPVLELDGPAGANYVVMVSTNLTDWSDVVTQKVDAPPMQWSDPEAGAAPSRFYRVRVQ